MQIILGRNDLRMSKPCGADRLDATSRCRDSIKLAYENFLKRFAEGTNG